MSKEGKKRVEIGLTIMGLPLTEGREEAVNSLVLECLIVCVTLDYFYID